MKTSIFGRRCVVVAVFVSKIVLRKTCRSSLLAISVKKMTSRVSVQIHREQLRNGR